MENSANNIGNSEEIWKGAGFWIEEITKAAVYGKLNHFNDVMTGKQPPSPESDYGNNPVLADVKLDGHTCDIYHSDHKRGDSGHRIFIHIKKALKD